MKPKHIKALAQAVRLAAGWRGEVVGHPAPSQLEAFDTFVKTAKEAMKELRQEQRRAIHGKL